MDADALWPVMLAGLSVWWWTTGPAEQLHRTQPADNPPANASPPRGLRQLWTGRPGAATWPRRTSLGAVTAVAVGLAVQRLGGTAWWLGWAVAPVLATAVVVLLGGLVPAESKRRGRRLMLDLPQALELLAAGLAAGMPLRQATMAVADAFEGPVAEDLGLVLTLVNLGVADADAWRALWDQPAWAAPAADLARSVESGTMMVDVLAHHARDARARRRTDLEVRARAVGVRSVLPLMCCFLPAFILLGVVPTVASAVANAIF